MVINKCLPFIWLREFCCSLSINIGLNIEFQYGLTWISRSNVVQLAQLQSISIDFVQFQFFLLLVVRFPQYMPVYISKISLKLMNLIPCKPFNLSNLVPFDRKKYCQSSNGMNKLFNQKKNETKQNKCQGINLHFEPRHHCHLTCVYITTEWNK